MTTAPDAIAEGVKAYRRRLFAHAQAHAIAFFDIEMICSRLQRLKEESAEKRQRLSLPLCDTEPIKITFIDLDGKRRRLEVSSLFADRILELKKRPACIDVISKELIGELGEYSISVTLESFYANVKKLFWQLHEKGVPTHYKKLWSAYVDDQILQLKLSGYEDLTRRVLVEFAWVCAWQIARGGTDAKRCPDAEPEYSGTLSKFLIKEVWECLNITGTPSTTYGRMIPRLQEVMMTPFWRRPCWPEYSETSGDLNGAYQLNRDEEAQMTPLEAWLCRKFAEEPQKDGGLGWSDSEECPYPAWLRAARSVPASTLPSPDRSESPADTGIGRP